MNYVARKGGLVPEDTYQQYLVESIQENLVDIFLAQMVVFRAPKEQKLEETKKFVKDSLDQRLTYVENRLKANESQDFLVGSKITTADILYLNAYFSNWQDPNAQPERNAAFKEILDKHPLFVEYIGKVRKVFDEYFEKHRIASDM